MAPPAPHAAPTDAARPAAAAGGRPAPDPARAACGLGRAGTAQTPSGAPASWGSRASPHRNQTATHRYPRKSQPFRPGCQPTGSVAFSHSTDHHPAEHGDASEEYERAYDDRDEPAGISERPRLRRPVAPARSGPRGRRGARGPVSAVTRATSCSPSSVECSPGRLSTRPGDARRARADPPAHRQLVPPAYAGPGPTRKDTTNERMDRQRNGISPSQPPPRERTIDDDDEPGSGAHDADRYSTLPGDAFHCPGRRARLGGVQYGGATRPARRLPSQVHRS